jgi:hypothetical protein
MIFIIGVGGVGSWLAPAMCLLAGKNNVTLVDGDKLERKNLNRQLFTDQEIGMNKAHALSEKYGCAFIPKWYSETLTEHSRHDWLVCVVDNHPGRLAVLRSVDTANCRAIFAANETHSSEAYYYQSVWKDTRLDPRVMYPEILTSREDDPRARSIGCTGEAQVANVQLVTANLSAAALAAHMYVVWAMESRKLNPEDHKHLPAKLVQNLPKNETHKVGEL